MSPFDWKGQPSVFTTCKDRANFIGINHERSLKAATREKLISITLPGGSHNLAPDVMRTPHRLNPIGTMKAKK